MPEPKIRQQIPAATIETLARSVHEQASAYGFTRLDHIRLASALLAVDVDESEADQKSADSAEPQGGRPAVVRGSCDSLPLETDHLVIEPLEQEAHRTALGYWLRDSFSRFFLLTSSGRYFDEPARLIGSPDQHLALIRLHSGHPVGAAAYLDHDRRHRRAEFRILVGDAAARKQGLGSEAACAWLEYGVGGLGLEKVFVQLLEGDVRSSRLFDKLGFGFEAFLKDEICLDGVRRNVERWALYRDAGAGGVSAA